MKKNNFFDNIRKSVSSFVKNSTDNITNIARETVARIIPRRVSSEPKEEPRNLVESPRVAEKPRDEKRLSAEGIEIDFSTRETVRSIEQELSGTRKAKEIAKELGISVQKWVSIRGKIRKGDLYGDAILERLESTKNSLDNSFEKFVEVEYTYTNPDGTHETRRGEVVFFPDEDRLKEKVPYSRSIKTVYTFSDAKNYWGQIGGGAEYFGIVSIGKGNYQVVDLRNQNEYNNRGKMNGEIRAKKILKNLNRGRIENEDE